MNPNYLNGETQSLFFKRKVYYEKIKKNLGSEENNLPIPSYLAKPFRESRISLNMDRAIKIIEDFYHKIADNNETVNFNYTSTLQEDNFKNILKRSLQKDKMIQRTSEGIHKDDIQFTLNGQLFKTIASQGQRKSLLFALKLAQYQLLKNYKFFSPILLLDDVFEKLDEKRMVRLLKWVCNDNDGQVFITDTHKQRLENIFDHLNVDGQLIEL